MNKNKMWNCLMLGMLLVVCTVRAKGLPGDAEAAAHGNKAATLQLIAETEQKSDDFIFRQYNLSVLSHYSYLIGSGGEAMIIDPARDIARYIEDADKLGLKITRVYLTHSHADFVAGHMELAKACGAEVIANAETQAGYPHQAVKDGAAIAFGSVRAVVITTPGHTPDGTCLSVYHPASAATPLLVLTGDTLFIGGVGRPDLMGEGTSAAELATMGYHSWNDKLSKLPDATKVFPAHGAGSLCGVNLSDKPLSTIGEERASNPYLQHKDLHSYVMAVIDGLPDAPQYFEHNAALNHAGPPLVDWENILPQAQEPKAVAALAKAGAWLLDVRNAAEFSAAYPADAINVGIRGRFETWAGTMIPWREPFVLIGSEDEVTESAFRLKRIGYDAPAGFLKGGPEAWKLAGLPMNSIQLVKPAALYQQMQEGTAPVIVDVRLPNEWMGVRIGNVLNIPLNILSTEAKRLSKEMPVLTVCNSSYRSSMGAAVLQKLGFKNVFNMEGGGEAWIKAGLPTLSAVKAAGGASAPVTRAIRLPERISSAELKRMMMDIPGTFEIVDIRPSAQFADFNLPGSIHADIADVISNPAFLAGAVPLILVDRDGSLAMAAGGILSQKSPRQIKVLYGGLENYWLESLSPLPSSSPGAPAMQPAAAPVRSQNPTSQPSQPATPKKKSAGC